MIMDSQGRVGPLLRELVAAGSLPPSLIFEGPEGCGKELTAVRLAAMLECTRNAVGGAGPDIALFDEAPAPASAAAAKTGAGSGGGACRCEACARVGRLEYPDFHPIYPIPHSELEKGPAAIIESRREDFFNHGEFGSRARSIGIDLVRGVIETLSKHPFEGKRSVVVLFEAHLATVEAQNALLKLLEEPPPSAAIILVTEFPDRLLPTILSRCTEIRFDPLSADAIAGFLGEFYAVEREEARRIAALAEGSLRRGIKLIDEQFRALWKDACGAAGLVIEGKGKELLGESAALAQNYTREEIEELLEEMAIIFGLFIRNREDRLGEAEKRGLEETLGPKRLVAASARDLPGDIRKILSSIESLHRNADVELTLSQVLLDLAGKWY